MKSNRRGFLKFLSTAPVASGVLPATEEKKAYVPIPKTEVKVGPHTLSASGYCYECGTTPGDRDGIHAFPHYYTAVQTPWRGF